jgi:hypothetical protein
MTDTLLTDIVEILRQGLDEGNLTPVGEQCREAADEIESLRQQLEAAMEADAHLAGKLSVVKKQLAECLAREKVLRDFIDVCIELKDTLSFTISDELDKVCDLPANSTALDTLKKQWQREAYLELHDMAMHSSNSDWMMNHCRQKAKELE